MGNPQGQGHPFPEITRGFCCLVSAVDFLVDFFVDIFGPFSQARKNPPKNPPKNLRFSSKLFDQNPLREISAWTQGDSRESPDSRKSAASASPEPHPSKPHACNMAQAKNRSCAAIFGKLRCLKTRRGGEHRRGEGSETFLERKWVPRRFPEVS